MYLGENNELIEAPDTTNNFNGNNWLIIDEQAEWSAGSGINGQGFIQIPQQRTIEQFIVRMSIYSITGAYQVQEYNVIANYSQTAPAFEIKKTNSFSSAQPVNNIQMYAGAATQYDGGYFQFTLNWTATEPANYKWLLEYKRIDLR